MKREMKGVYYFRVIGSTHQSGRGRGGGGVPKSEALITRIIADIAVRIISMRVMFAHDKLI